jgi:hypothetical protein
VDSFQYQCLDEIPGPEGVDFMKGFMKEAKVLGRAIYICMFNFYMSWNKKTGKLLGDLCM